MSKLQTIQSYLTNDNVFPIPGVSTEEHRRVMHSLTG